MKACLRHRTTRASLARYPLSRDGGVRWPRGMVEWPALVPPIPFLSIANRSSAVALQQPGNPMP
eukprot:363630-Chlamydomonas_euryale.AAC.3